MLLVGAPGFLAGAWVEEGTLGVYCGRNEGVGKFGCHPGSLVCSLLGLGPLVSETCYLAFAVSPCRSSYTHVAKEAPRQPAGGGQTRLSALSDTGHTQAYCHLVQEPNAYLRGERGWLCVAGRVFLHSPSRCLPQSFQTPEAGLREMCVEPLVIALFTQVCLLQDSRFEVSKNGTLRINSVEVYDGTLYRCVSSTPAGSIEAQARVQVLGELAYMMCWESARPVWAEEQWGGAAGMALASLPVSIPPLLLPHRPRETQVHAPAAATAVHGV